MSIPLNSVTQKPVEYFNYGFDDTELGQSGFFGTVVQWDIHEKEDSFKAHFVFIVKKAFEFLDFVGIGSVTFGEDGFSGQLTECYAYQTGIERNKDAREKIAQALGGKDVCNDIPVVDLQKHDFTDYLKLGDAYFRSGEWVVQGEDPAGRKFVLLRVVHRTTGKPEIMTVYQRFRETSIVPGSKYDGSLWMVGDETGFPVRFNVDEAAEFIEKIRTFTHEQFVIALKP